MNFPFLNKPSKHLKGFTLVEMLIVIGILAVLVVVVVSILNPAEFFKKTRDSRRMVDLQTLDKALRLADFDNVFMGVVSTIYVSIPDPNTVTTSTCSGLGLPEPLPSGWSYQCSSPANYRKIDGTGWIPINFTALITVPSALTLLPIDPTNSASGFYYTYINGSWELTALFETTDYQTKYASTDNGTSTVLYEIGNHLKITPDLLARRMDASKGAPSVPRSLTANYSNQQIIVNWLAPLSEGGSSITGYKVYRSTASGEQTLLTTLNKVLTYTDTSLASGTTYYYKISAVNAIGESSQSSEASTLTASAPSTPQTLTATYNNQQIVLNWSVPSSDGGSSITGYKVYSGTTSGGETLLTTLGNVLTYTNTSPTSGTTYYYKVSAVNAAGEGSQSSEASVSTSSGIPSAPQTFTATYHLSGSDSQIILNWSAPSSDGGSSITSYNVYRGDSSGGETLMTTLGNVLTYTDTCGYYYPGYGCVEPSLPANTTYYYKVSAVNAAGEGTKSSEASAATPDVVPSAPYMYGATAGNQQITLNWEYWGGGPGPGGGGSAVTSYKIYRGTSSGGETLLTTVAYSYYYQEYINTGLANSTTYYYKVSAVNGAGEGPQSSEVSAITSSGLPLAPQTLTATAGDTQIVLNWSVPSDNGGSSIANYKVYRGTISGGETLLTTLGNVLTYTNTGLTSGTTYYYKVSAVNATGEGIKSSEVSTTPSVPPSAPQTFTTTYSNQQIIINWLAPSNNGGSSIINYNIYRGTSSGGEALMTTLGNVLTYTDTCGYYYPGYGCVEPSLPANTTYYYKVSAVNAAGEGTKSSEASAATPDIVPSAPYMYSATADDQQITIGWENPDMYCGGPGGGCGSAVTNYKIYRGTSSGGETLLTTLGNVLTYTNTGLTNGTTYYYKVSAVNGAGEGLQSSEVSAIPAGSPSAPQTFTATYSNQQIIINWLAPSNNGGSSIINYNIYRGTSSGGEALMTTLGNVLTYTDTCGYYYPGYGCVEPSLSPNTTYYYKVSAVNAAKEGTQSNEASAATPDVVPSAPYMYGATAGNQQITIEWEDPSMYCGGPGGGCGSAVTNYKIYRGTSSGGETLLTTVASNAYYYQDYTDTGLTNGTTYYYKVSAVNGAGEGLQSSEVSATTP